MTIDGRHISEWGLRVAEGCLSDWFKLPRRKSVSYNNWAESHGIDPDLSVVEWEETSIKLSFIMSGDNPSLYMGRFRSLIKVLTEKGSRVISYLGITRTLYYDQGNGYEGTPIIEQRGAWAVLSLTMKEEEPEIVKASPTYAMNPKGQYAINGIDLAGFGIGGEQEDEDLWKYPGMKTPFTDGETYDLSAYISKHKEIRLSLWWVCKNTGLFVQNRKALLWQLSRPNALSLYAKSIGGSTYAYYTGCSSFEANMYGNKVGVRMTMVFTVPIVEWIEAGGIVKYKVLMDSELGLLADENGNLVVFN